MKRAPVNTAREIGQKSGAVAVLIIVSDGASWSATTWGKTRRECGALSDYADAGGFDCVAMAIAEVVS